MKTPPLHFPRKLSSKDYSSPLSVEDEGDIFWQDEYFCEDPEEDQEEASTSLWQGGMSFINWEIFSDIAPFSLCVSAHIPEEDTLRLMCGTMLLLHSCSLEFEGENFNFQKVRS